MPCVRMQAHMRLLLLTQGVAVRSSALTTSVSSHEWQNFLNVVNGMKEPRYIYIYILYIHRLSSCFFSPSPLQLSTYDLLICQFQSCLAMEDAWLQVAVEAKLQDTWPKNRGKPPLETRNVCCEIVKEMLCTVFKYIEHNTMKYHISIQY